MTAALLGEFVHGLDASRTDPSLLDTVRLHVFDTIGAAFAGSEVADTLELVDALGPVLTEGDARVPGLEMRTALPLAALLSCAAVRCTEIDDIHTGACVTPGSAIVPVALAVAAGVEVDDRRFLEACLAGYEVLIRFGVAAAGPRILYKGIWPTYLCAGFGVAATVGKLLDLSADEIAHALAIAATLATGTTGGRAPGLTSRWFLLGAAVQSALVATFCAARAMHGDLALLGERWSAITGIPLDTAALVDGLGDRFHAAETSFKPYCAAKQTIAAIDAFAELLDGNGGTADAIAEVLVEVPSAYAKMIDHEGLPKGRLDSISSVRYQLALVACARERQLDVTRHDVALDDEGARVHAKVRIAVEPSFENAYPQQWPARVTVADASGKRESREVFRALGDPGTDFGWPQVREKFRRVAPLAAGRTDALAAACKRLGEPGSLRALLEQL